MSTAFPDMNNNTVTDIAELRVVPEWVGWLVVCGVGFLFAGLMLVVTWVGFIFFSPLCSSVRVFSRPRFSITRSATATKKNRHRQMNLARRRIRCLRDSWPPD